MPLYIGSVKEEDEENHKMNCTQVGENQNKRASMYKLPVRFAPMSSFDPQNHAKRTTMM